MTNFLRFAWFTLSYCVAVILWGAYVRATGSGAGCGAHWPRCNGEIFHRPENIKTLIEFSHRLTSGLSLLFVLALAIWAFRIFSKGSFQRKAAGWSALAIVMEALIGAGLVLLRLVEHDKSIDRVISISLHLGNTLLLLAALTTLTLSARPSPYQPRWKWDSLPERRKVNLLLAGFVLLGGMGAMAALGDTLFPSESLAAGIAADFDGRRHFLERIRIFHPLVAVAWVFGTWAWVSRTWARHPELYKLGLSVMGFSALNLTIGVVNILLLAPIPVQILHLLCANLLWISFVGFVYSASVRQV